MIKFKAKKKRFSFFSIIANSWILGILPAAIIILLLPDLFQKYEITNMQSYRRDKDKLLTFFEDVNKDGSKEKIDILNYRNRFACSYFWKDDTSLLSQFNFYGYIPNQENLTMPIFVDVNKNGIKEMFVFTQKEDSLFLNAVNFSTLEVILYGRFVSTIGMGDGKKDFVLRPIINHDYNNDSIPEIYFLLNGCYSLYPRKIMAYDFKNDTFISTINTGSQHYVTPIIQPDGKLILISTTSGTGNCPADFPYAYTDSCAWLFEFNDHLELINNPISFAGFACTVNGPVIYEDEYHYYISNEEGKTRTNYIISTDLTGAITEKKDISKIIFGEKFVPITYKNKIHYLISCSENNLFKVYEYNPRKMQLEQNRLTQKIPNSSLVPFEINKNSAAFIAFDHHTSLSRILLDNLKQKVFLDSNPYIKSYNLYLQTQNISKGEIIMVTDREFLYTYLLSKNAYYSFRYILFIIIYLLNVGFLILAHYLQRRRSLIREKLQKEITALQLQLVNSQLDPHFIFNALNTVSSKILKGERLEAYDLMNNFSSMMRSAMLFSDKDRWSMEEELKFTNDYLTLMKVRFKSLFDYSIVIADDIQSNEIFIPRLLIQNFVENAIKHAFYGIDYQGILSLTAKRLNNVIEIEIADNGIGCENAQIKAEQSSNKSGNGVRLNRKQVKIFNQLYQTDIRFEIEDLISDNLPSGTRVRISIPIKL